MLFQIFSVDGLLENMINSGHKFRYSLEFVPCSKGRRAEKANKLITQQNNNWFAELQYKGFDFLLQGVFFNAI